MATWTFERDGADIVVIRRDAKGCCERGRGQLQQLQYLVGVVLSRATAWELVQTEQGLFAKQVGPRGTV